MSTQITPMLSSSLETSSEEPGATCSLCNDLINLKILACGHMFHVSCIDNWLSHNVTCPLCRSGQCSATISRAEEGSECAVCLENMMPTVSLQCGHCFHCHCIQSATEFKKCPVCSTPCFIDDMIDMNPCRFCQELVTENEKTLPCGHTFHNSCIEMWMRDNNECPECKGPLEEASNKTPFDLDECLACNTCASSASRECKVYNCGHFVHENCIPFLSGDGESCPLCPGPETSSEVATALPVQCYTCGSRIASDEIVLSCDHRFHKSCVSTWLVEAKVCPQCLVPVEPPEDLLTNNQKCLFCSEFLTAGAATLPCGHRFHKNCVSRWRNEEKMCPECLLPIEEEEEEARTSRIADADNPHLDDLLALEEIVRIDNTEDGGASSSAQNIEINDSTPSAQTSYQDNDALDECVSSPPGASNDPSFSEPSQEEIPSDDPEPNSITQQEDYTPTTTHDIHVNSSSACCQSCCSHTSTSSTNENSTCLLCSKAIIDDEKSLPCGHKCHKNCLAKLLSD